MTIRSINTQILLSHFIAYRHHLLASMISLLFTGIPFFLYQLTANFFLRVFDVADFGHDTALSSTLKFYLFGFPVAVFALWRRWSKASEFLRAGSAVFLPIMVATATYSLRDSGSPSFNGDYTVAMLTYLEVLKNIPVVYLAALGYWLIMFRSPLARWVVCPQQKTERRSLKNEDASWFFANELAAGQEWSVTSSLRAEALETSLISIVLAVNVATLTVVVLLAVGISSQAASTFCIVIAAGSGTSLCLCEYLLKRGRFDCTAEHGLIAMAVLMAGSWGSLAVFASDWRDPRSGQLLLALLTCGGLAMILLSAQRLLAVLAGSIALFGPFIAMSAIDCRDHGSLYITASGICILVTLGFGYTINRQHQHRTELRFALQKANVEIESKSAKLRQALIAADEANCRVKREYKLRERLLRSVSHDLRQPISALGLFLRQLTKQELPKQVGDLISKCRLSATSANEIIDSITQQSWHSGQVRIRYDDEFDLGPLLNRLVTELRHEAQSRGTKIQIVFTSLRVSADERLVERIMRNFLSNAVRVTNQGRVLVGARRRGTYAEILCFDTGPGFCDSEREQIFEEFYQIRSAKLEQCGSLGLGLSIVKELADQIGARIIVRSRAGRGSVFGIVLPLVR